MTGNPAVVLLSGGLDSTTVLAIARSEGYVPYALSFRYGQRHDVELDAARRVAEAQGVARHVVADIDLRVFGGSALTDDIDVPHHDSADDLGEGIPVTYVPARNTVFLSFALAWAETLGCSDVFIGVNALDYSGYPDCRPEYIAAYEQMANLATKAGVEGTPAPEDPHPADRPDQGPDHRAGPGAGRGLRADPQLLRPGPRGPRVRHLRLLPAAAAGDSPKSAWPTLRWPWRRRARRHDLPGQGDLLHPAGRGHPRRAGGGVLPVHQLQPVDRAGKRPPPRDLPVLRHRLRRHGRPRRGPVRHGSRPG